MSNKKNKIKLLYFDEKTQSFVDNKKPIKIEKGFLTVTNPYVRSILSGISVDEKDFINQHPEKFTKQ